MQQHVDWLFAAIHNCSTPGQSFVFTYNSQTGICGPGQSISNKFGSVRDILNKNGASIYSFCYMVDRLRTRPAGIFDALGISEWFPGYGSNPFSLTELKRNVKCIQPSSDFVTLKYRVTQGNPLYFYYPVRANASLWDMVGIQPENIICGGIDFEANSALGNFHMPPRRNTPLSGSFADVGGGAGRDCYDPVNDSTSWLSSQTFFMMKNRIDLVNSPSLPSFRSTLGSEFEGTMNDIFFENDLKVMYLFGTRLFQSSSSGGYEYTTDSTSISTTGSDMSRAPTSSSASELGSFAF
jgi:hypothetical protein